MTDTKRDTASSPNGSALSEGLGPARGAFETWASKEGWPLSDIADKCTDGAPRGGEYRHQGLQDAWEVWQASASTERDRCAKLCENLGPQLLRWWGDGQANAACQECATAIRGA